AGEAADLVRCTERRRRVGTEDQSPGHSCLPPPAHPAARRRRSAGDGRGLPHLAEQADPRRGAGEGQWRSSDGPHSCARSSAHRGRSEHFRLGTHPMMETTMASRQRKLRNYLLDAPLQLRFTAVLVLATLLCATLLGIFLARALNRLGTGAAGAGG